MDTRGWDTVYVVPVKKVNESLAQAGSEIPQSFDYGENGLAMSGTFGAWKIVAGGSGNLLRMEFPVESGTLTMPGQPQANLDGVVLVADVSLQMLPAGVESKSLVFDMRAVGQEAQQGAGIVTPVALEDPNGVLDAAQNSMVYSLLPECLVDLAPQITYVFGEVNLAKPAEGGWLAPVDCDYACLQKEGDASDGWLAILAVTTDRDISGLQRDIDPGIVSGGASAGYLISEDLFLANVILPAMPSAYPGTSQGNFAYSPTDTAIHNTTSLPTQSVRSGAITYHPQIDYLTTSVDGGSLATSISGSCDLKASISMTYEIGLNNAAVYDPSQQTLSFEPDANPRADHQAKIPWYWDFLAPIVTIIVNAIVPAISGDIADALRNDAAKPVAAISLQSVQWSGTSGLQVTEAGLDGCFYAQGVV